MDNIDLTVIHSDEAYSMESLFLELVSHAAQLGNSTKMWRFATVRTNF